MKNSAITAVLTLADDQLIKCNGLTAPGCAYPLNGFGSNKGVFDSSQDYVGITKPAETHPDEDISVPKFTATHSIFAKTFQMSVVAETVSQPLAEYDTFIGRQKLD